MKIDRIDPSEKPSITYKSVAKDIVYSSASDEERVKMIIAAQRDAVYNDLLFLLEILESECTENKGGGTRPIDFDIQCVKKTMSLLGMD